MRAMLFRFVRYINRRTNSGQIRVVGIFFKTSGSGKFYFGNR